MQDLLSRAQNYINFEEKMLGEKTERVKALTRKKERSNEEKGPKGGYLEYIVLNTSRERILKECFNSELDDAGIRYPKGIKENSRTDKGRFCKFHMSPRHDAKECIQLKDAIEEQIRQGKLNKYTNESKREDYVKEIRFV
jgi:hypothetical protein